MQHSNVMSLVGGTVHGFASPTEDLMILVSLYYMEERNLIFLLLSDVKRREKERKRQRMEMKEVLDVGDCCLQGVLEGRFYREKEKQEAWNLMKRNRRHGRKRKC